MANETLATEDFFLQLVKMSVRYSFVIYPVTFATLQKVLKTQDYKIPKTPSDNLMTAGILELDGTVGMKEGLTVSTQIDKQVLGVGGNDIEKIIVAFNELEKALSSEIGQELSSKALFYEAVLQFGVRTGRNPLEVLAKLGKNYPHCGKMSQILGQPVAPLSFKFSPSGIPIDSTDWFEFSVEPMINRATSAYFSGYILRSSNRSGVLERVRNSKQTVSSAIQLLESD